MYNKYGHYPKENNLAYKYQGSSWIVNASSLFFSNQTLSSTLMQRYFSRISRYMPPITIITCEQA